MTIASEIIAKLETTPYFRERRFRERYLLEMVMAKNKVNAMFIPSTQVGDIIKDYVSYERIWRDVLQAREDLRGEDWSDGRALAQGYQIKELGKEVGYERDVKELAKIL